MCPTPDIKRQPDPPKGSVKIIIDEPQTVERIYSNHVELRLSPIDATLSFCDIDPSRAMRETNEGLEIKANLKCRIVLPFAVFVSLAQLLTSRVDEVQLPKEVKE